jgi:hypothetical protein
MGKEKNWAIAFAVLALISIVLLAGALIRPIVDLPIARNTSINDSAAAKGIEFMTMKQALADPWYRAMLQSDHPVNANSPEYFINNLPANGSCIVMEFKSWQPIGVGEKSEDTAVFWGLNKNLSKPLRWTELNVGPKDCVLKTTTAAEFIYVYNKNYFVCLWSIGVMLFAVLSGILWKIRWR